MKIKTRPSGCPFSATRLYSPSVLSRLPSPHLLRSDLFPVASPPWLSASRLEIISTKLSSGPPWVSEDHLGASDVKSPQHRQPGSLPGPHSFLCGPLERGTAAAPRLPRTAEPTSTVREEAPRQEPPTEAEGTPTEVCVLVLPPFSLQQLIKRCQAI